MKTLFQAQEALFTYTPELDEECVDLRLAAGRVLARPEGNDEQGEPLVKAKRFISVGDCAALAMLGIGQVWLRKLPRAGLLILAEPGDTRQLQGAEAACLAAAAHWGGETVQLNAEQEDRILAISAALDRCDLLTIICAEPPRLHRALVDVGAADLFDAVAIVPGGAAAAVMLHGKPVLLFHADACEACVNAELFLGPLVRNCLQHVNRSADLLRAELRGELGSVPERLLLAPAELEIRGGILAARPTRDYAPGNCAALGRSGCFVLVPGEIGGYDRHSIVEVLPFGGGPSIYS